MASEMIQVTGITVFSYIIDRGSVVKKLTSPNFVCLFVCYSSSFFLGGGVKFPTKCKLSTSKIQKIKLGRSSGQIQILELC